MNIFTDGSFMPGTYNAGIGVVGRKNISAKIKARTCLAAEIIAIIRALETAKKGDVIFNDSTVAVLVFRRKKIVKGHELLCINAHALYNKISNVLVKWVIRSKNRKADTLARRGRKHGPL